MPIEYYDDSFVVKPEKSVRWVDFDAKPYDKGKLISTFNYYTLTDEDAAKQGCGEYTRYVGQYAK
jgi:hypothetical protein